MVTACSLVCTTRKQAPACQIRAELRYRAWLSLWKIASSPAVSQRGVGS